MAYDPATRTVLLFSGIRGDGSPPLGDTWTWDGCRWTQANPATSPPGRSFGALAFDETSRHVVLFGGGSANSDPLRTDTWSWDGSSWKQAHPQTSPPRLDHPLMAADRDNHDLLLIGNGLQGGAMVTWTWDGSNWTERHPSTSPPRRGNAALADGAKSGVLLFGGQPGEAGALNDTWVWDGSNWRQLHPPTAPNGGPVVMVHQESRHDVLMIGTDGTWVWTGADWIKQHPTSSPPFELFRTVADDAARGRVVLFGGKSPQTNVATGEMWTWDGAAWTSG